MLFNSQSNSANVSISLYSTTLNLREKQNNFINSNLHSNSTQDEIFSDLSNTINYFCFLFISSHSLSDHLRSPNLYDNQTMCTSRSYQSNTHLFRLQSNTINKTHCHSFTVISKTNCHFSLQIHN